LDYLSLIITSFLQHALAQFLGLSFNPCTEIRLLQHTLLKCRETSCRYFYFV